MARRVMAGSRIESSRDQHAQILRIIKVTAHVSDMGAAA